MRKRIPLLIYCFCIFILSSPFDFLLSVNPNVIHDWQLSDSNNYEGGHLTMIFPQSPRQNGIRIQKQRRRITPTLTHCFVTLPTTKSKCRARAPMTMTTTNDTANEWMFADNNNIAKDDICTFPTITSSTIRR